ncbi:MAG: hypothetical protein AUH30_10455 [Candidatus Rokubacteria bacterium 13_1_40CM_68_15]|nr:MAG: hypothetical protein AUH30_10455 [Candidatus Rokubacteria bacterium 13_1_40CM_68_15]
MTAATVDLSVVLPVYNEADNLPILWEELVAVLPGVASAAEVIFVDDGSTDGSADVVEGLAKTDSRIRFIRFETNAGLSAAFYAGFQAARGRIVVSMDSDLQNDPRDIPLLIARLDGADVVVGWRQIRRDGWLRRISSTVANRVRTRLTQDPVADSASSFRAMRRECLAAIPPYAGMHRFVPTLVKLAGFRVVEIPVSHRPRRFGASKFGVRNRALRAFIDLLAVRWMIRRRLRYRIAQRPCDLDADVSGAAARPQETREQPR